MSQQSQSKRPHEFAWSIDAQILDLERIDEEGVPLKDYKLVCVIDVLSSCIIDIRVEPSSQFEDPGSPQ